MIADVRELMEFQIVQRGLRLQVLCNFGVSGEEEQTDGVTIKDKENKNIIKNSPYNKELNIINDNSNSINNMNEEKDDKIKQRGNVIEEGDDKI